MCVVQNAIALCESVLNEILAYNREKCIWPNDVIVIERMLGRRAELANCYCEITEKLQGNRFRIFTVLDSLIGFPYLYGPESSDKARQDKERLVILNKEISELAFDLAELIEERTQLNEQSDYHSECPSDIVEIIDASATHNELYLSWVRRDLKALHSRFASRYWPSLSTIVATIGLDAQYNLPVPRNEVVVAATESSRPSKADQLRALVAGLQALSADDVHLESFQLSDEALASLGNCLFDLPPEEIVDATYIKRLRQRRREKEKHK